LQLASGSGDISFPSSASSGSSGKLVRFSGDRLMHLRA